MTIYICRSVSCDLVLTVYYSTDCGDLKSGVQSALCAVSKWKPNIARYVISEHLPQ